jgi:hypothetical protein
LEPLLYQLAVLETRIDGVEEHKCQENLMQAENIGRRRALLETVSRIYNENEEMDPNGRCREKIVDSW